MNYSGGNKSVSFEVKILNESVNVKCFNGHFGSFLTKSEEEC